MTTLLERAAQLRARAAQLEAQEREKKRKADAHRKILLGALVIKSGLGEWSDAELLGALLVIAERGDGGRAAFATRGQNALAKQNPTPTPSGA